MPRQVRKPCSQAGCPNTTPRGGPCDEHRRQRERQRKADGNAVYTQSAWQRVRKRFLYHNPWCSLCARQATVADHWPVSRRDLVAQGVADPDSHRNLRPLCKACHDRETARLQPGGFIAERSKPVIKIFRDSDPGG